MYYAHLHPTTSTQPLIKIICGYIFYTGVKFSFTKKQKNFIAKFEYAWDYLYGKSQYQIITIEMMTIPFIFKLFGIKKRKTKFNE